MAVKNFVAELDSLRQAINNVYRSDETACVQERMVQAELPPEMLLRIRERARALIVTVRQTRLKQSGLDAFLQEYDLSSAEGIALMCLAEALLRVPDADTANELIQDKIATVDWRAHVGKSDSFFVNAATWSLMLTGKMLAPQDKKANAFSAALQRFLGSTSKPVVQQAVRQAMKILGQQFVLGRTIEEAIQNAQANEAKGYTYSYDMLGEAARTAADADRCFKAYQTAITAISHSSAGISVKLSALHPRYEYSQREISLPIVIERVRLLALQAQAAGIALSIDAEEADRLDLSLDVIAALIKDPALAQWDGLGLAVQAYQKRAYPVIEWLIALARGHHRRLNVRLVKGAYWDYEIKDSQVKGLAGYPVFTRKAATDISYIACAKLMLRAPDAIYPQFASHNAQTVATILELVGDNKNFEFQCLHGMGAALYNPLIDRDNIHCRIYAPVGTHEELLAYLVRRLLENGANTSFVNRIIDETVPVDELVIDPITKLKSFSALPHPRIPLPADIFGSVRKNSQGMDLSDRTIQHSLEIALNKDLLEPWGNIKEATTEVVASALQRAEATVASWDQMAVAERAGCLERAADLLEQHREELMAIAIREAGKTLADAVGEVREAVDFCRYYAARARQDFAPQMLPGPTGETNQLQLHGRGITVCISPWNFPLAIFVGQIAAALVTGNPVIAKPAEQTPRMAVRAVALFHQAGIPPAVLQLLPGSGETVGAALVADPRVAAVVFTGSTATARLINRTLAHRLGALPTLIAETGGQNAMIVDSTALPEQVVTDVLQSAFNSAGQRCSALRVLYVQEEVADKIITMLRGAMAELQVGDPALLKTDIGPVIDQEAFAGLQAHLDYLAQKQAKLLYRVSLPPDAQQKNFFAPCAYEIPSIHWLKQEVFGPILHVIRYAHDQLNEVIQDINSTGYGLTLGIQTRINEKVEWLQKQLMVGNIYVNRNMIGAVVGVQPFGGQGLSGTGPKAGGPHYLPRFCVERTLTINTTAGGGNASLMTLGE